MRWPWVAYTGSCSSRYADLEEETPALRAFLPHSALKPHLPLLSSVRTSDRAASLVQHHQSIAFCVLQSDHLLQDFGQVLRQQTKHMRREI
jgi:hypothetical protein